MGQEKVMKIVVDTNVLISALLFAGTPGKLIELWENGLVDPLISEEILNEYVRVLAYPKFKLTEDEINYLLYQQILPYFKVVKSIPSPSIVHKDPDDDKFIRCALAGRAKIIISGDRHLLSIKSIQGIKILTPAQFLDKWFRSQ